MGEVLAIDSKLAVPIAIGRLDPTLDDIEIRLSLLGKALKRIGKFCEKYDTDAKPDYLIRAVHRDFVSTAAHEFFLYIAVRGDRVVAHLLANVINHYGFSFGYVSQLEIDDDAQLTDEQVRKGFMACQRWAFENGATAMRAGAIMDAHMRVFRKFGFGDVIVRTVGKAI